MGIEEDDPPPATHTHTHASINNGCLRRTFLHIYLRINASINAPFLIHL